MDYEPYDEEYLDPDFTEIINYNSPEFDEFVADEEAKGAKDEDFLEKLIVEVELREPLWENSTPLVERSKNVKDRLWNEIFFVFKGN